MKPGGKRAGGLPDLGAFRSVMIVKPSSLGDIVHTLPAVHAIHEAWPHLRLRWVANTEWTPLLEGCPLLHEVVPFPRKSIRGLRGPLNFLKWAQDWRQAATDQPELVLDFQGLLRSGLISRSRGSWPVIGLSDSREGAAFFHDHVVPVNPQAHAVDRYLCLPEALGIPVKGREPVFVLPEGSEPAGWPGGKDLIVVHPWSRGEGKTLDPETLEALCAALAPRPVVLVGMKPRPDTPVPRGAHITDLSQRTTLKELIWLLREARFVVSVDSGPMHMAAAVNDNTLGIHTWTDPRKVGPRNSKARVWKAARICHTAELSDSECRVNAIVTPEAARQMATFVHQQLQGS